MGHPAGGCATAGRHASGLQDGLVALQNGNSSHGRATACNGTVTGPALRSEAAPTVVRMRPTTFICALAATLQLLSGTALAGGWTWPIRGPVITTYRNGDDPYAAGQHRGVDIGAPVGSQVVAATPGTVTFAGVVGSAGLVVSERSADGRFDLSYLHLSSTSVHRGDRLAEGAALGSVGTSGRRS